MKIVRDPIAVALDDLLIACLEAAEIHRAGAAASGAEPMAATLSRLAGDRAETASILAEEVRRLGDSPMTEPIRERILFEKAAVHLGALVGDTTKRAIPDHCRRKERRILECSEAVLGLPVSSSIREHVMKLRADAAQRLDRP